MSLNGAFTPTRRATAIGALVLVVALLAAWLLVLSPRSEAVAKVSDEVTLAAAANDALRGQVAARQAQEAKLPEQRAASKALDVRFPPSAEQAELFAMITDAAAEAGIAAQRVTNLTVDPPVGGAAGGPTSAQLPGVAAPRGEIAAQRVSMDVRGTPAQVREMVANLEALPRAFGVESIGLSTQGGAPGGAGGRESQAATITGQMYVMPELVDPTLS